MDYKKSRAQSGYTLAEIMVTVAILGVLSLAVINQVQMSASTKRDSNDRAVMNIIYDRLAVELSRQETCSHSLNFGGRYLPQLDITAPIKYGDGITTIIQKNKYYSLKNGALVEATGAATSSVKVSLVKLTPVPNTNIAKLEVTFDVKKSFSLASLLGKPKITLDLNVIPEPGNPTKIQFCFNDITTSVTAAIRLSCIGNGSVFEEPTVYPPYGRCITEDTAVSCGDGLYIRRIATSNGKIATTCAPLTYSCSVAGEVVVGFQANGNVVCDFPLPQCQAGQFMVRHSSGSFVCSKSDIGCHPGYAIQGFNADGSINCQPYYPAKTCPSGYYATEISPTTGIVCAPGATKAITCGVGKFVSGTAADGTPICSNWITAPFSCPLGTGAVGILANGNLDCKPLVRRLSCNGSFSPAPKTFSDCTANGGVVQNRDGGINSFCRMPGSSCPAGFTPCLSWGNSSDLATTSCTDTNSACSYSVSTRSVSGANIFTNPVSSSQRQATCYYWARNPGPWVQSCTQASSFLSAQTAVTEVGCY